MTPQQHKTVRDIIRWQRIGCITVKISRKFNIPILEALDLFYKSNTCRRFHDENTGLYLFGDNYVIDELVREYQG